MARSWLALLERKFQTYFTDPSDPNIRRWLNTAERAVDQKGSIYLQLVEKDQSVSGKRVLDAGCGDGAISIRFALAGAQGVGVEADHDFVEIARLRMQEYDDLNLTFMEEDLCSPTVRVQDSQFDLILSIDVIEHVHNANAYIHNLVKFLSSNGKIYLFTGNKLSLANIRRDPHYGIFGIVILPKFLARWIVISLLGKVRVFDVVEMFTPSNLEQICVRAGLKVTNLADADFDAMLTKKTYFNAVCNFPFARHLLRRVYGFWYPTLRLVAFKPEQ